MAQAIVGISTFWKRCFESFFCKAGRCPFFFLIITSVDGLTGVLILWYLYTKLVVLLPLSFYYAVYPRPAVESLHFGTGSKWHLCSFIVNQFATLRYRCLIFLNVCNITISNCSSLWLWRPLLHVCFVWLPVQKYNFLSQTLSGKL